MRKLKIYTHTQNVRVNSFHSCTSDFVSLYFIFSVLNLNSTLHFDAHAFNGTHILIGIFDYLSISPASLSDVVYIYEGRSISIRNVYFYVHSSMFGNEEKY